MKIAIVGVTGLVGTEILEVLKQSSLPVTEIIPVATEKSAGKTIEFKGKKYTVTDIEDGINRNAEIAIFSAGGSTSLKYAERFAERGTYVVDNSSAWRMDRTKKLIIPEINADSLSKNDMIIANPNCSTIQMLMALNPLQKKYGIKRIIVSTYQSVSGSGIKAVRQLERETVKASIKLLKNDNISLENFNKENGNQADFYPYQIYQNCIPQCDDFTENGYTKEEMKLINETHKIFNDYDIKISATAVRVPVSGAHSESVNVELNTAFDLQEIKNLISQAPGVVLQDVPSDRVYPMPYFCRGKNEVFVGRIRKDLSNENALNMWIVGDNLRKGAATNAVQIAEFVYIKFIQ